MEPASSWKHACSHLDPAYCNTSPLGAPWCCVSLRLLLHKRVARQKSQLSKKLVSTRPPAEPADGKGLVKREMEGTGLPFCPNSCCLPQASSAAFLSSSCTFTARGAHLGLGSRKHDLCKHPAKSPQMLPGFWGDSLLPLFAQHWPKGQAQL